LSAGCNRASASPHSLPRRAARRLSPTPPGNAGIVALLAEEQIAGRLRIAPRIVAVPPPIAVTPVSGIDHEGGIAAKFAVIKSLVR
jgi:hypothetical protein